MSALLCPLCRQMVTTAHAPIRRSAPGATLTDVLQTAALAHLAEFHKAEIERCVEVGNLMTLWAAANLFESTDPAWIKLKDHQADVLLNLILGPEEVDQATLQKGVQESAGEVVEITRPPAA